MKVNYTIPLLDSSRMQDQSFVAQFELPKRAGSRLQVPESLFRRSVGRRSGLGIQKHQKLGELRQHLQASLPNTFKFDLQITSSKLTER